MDSRRRLEHWHAAGALSGDGFATALAELGLRPDVARWRVLAARLLLACGVLAVLAGIIMAFAANWLAWPRLARAALAEGLLAAALAAAWHGRRHPVLHRWAVFAMTGLIGVVLAVIGQAYQTGADAWQLFALWAALALPWALYARWLPLWLLWFVVATLALTTWQGRSRLEVLLLLGADELNLPLLLLWGAGWGACARWAQQDWARRGLPPLLALGLTAGSTLPACVALADGSASVILPDVAVAGSAMVVVLWVGWIALQTWLAFRLRSLTLLALSAFAGWVALLSLLTNLGRMEDIVVLLALFAVLLLAGIGGLLRHWHRAWQRETSA
ncbi:DUF2157 domain-containing protein [Chitiniphilus purpureus]|uniref:DUF2157 domain-containing protein n=1 Tax=Chitiniphilus purpureus TaxID=2981137 RepID=A0ABY6DIM6_9NEIS|nr:DUF2157 domain-containing protein [Chitiniphilus sp. CD1]UXY13892.1 DUF2157 domain-containing protein [Chitiniphilus sp. CD1]